jgi:SAM-dependent methyltransferase
MINSNLVQHCSCGNTENFIESTINDINVLTCDSCGVIHQKLKDFNNEKYFNFYKDEYHNQYQKHKGVITYQDRYEHDVKVANLRLAQYQDYIKAGMRGLDIGSSNSAFIHASIAQGIFCTGLEPGADIGDDAFTIRGTLDTVDFEERKFDFITMHDSIEHIVDINFALQKVYSLLEDNGVLILDLPDYFVPEGRHHWKYIEHLWFFSRDQLDAILTTNGFTVNQISSPISGKLVFYCRK